MTGGLSFSMNQKTKGCQFSSNRSARLIFAVPGRLSLQLAQERKAFRMVFLWIEKEKGKAVSTQTDEQIQGGAWSVQDSLVLQMSTARGGLACPSSGHTPGLTHLLALVKWWISLEFGNHRQEKHSTVLTCKNHTQKGGRLCRVPKSSLASTVCHTAKIYSWTTGLDIKENLWVTFSRNCVRKKSLLRGRGKSFSYMGKLLMTATTKPWERMFNQKHCTSKENQYPHHTNCLTNQFLYEKEKL